MKIREFILVGSILFFNCVANALITESSPQEAPYVDEDEFGEPLSEPDYSAIEEEFSAEVSDDESAGSEVSGEPNEVEVSDVSTYKDKGQTTPSQFKEKNLRQGRSYINHHLAGKGLLAISKDGAYIYETQESRNYNHTTVLRFATIDAPDIEAVDGTKFSTMYGAESLSTLMFDYEWQPITRFGKLGLQVGLGLIQANGKGRFDTADPVLRAQEAKEKYTFLAIPISFGAIYRLEWLKRQWFAPYISGGVNYFPVVEFRDDNASPKMVGTPGAYGAGGLMLNLSAASRETGFVLSSEYGISNLWICLEYRVVQTFNEELDFSSDVMSAGIAVDY